MKIHSLHLWDLTPREAIAVQERLRSRVVAEDRLGKLRAVAGVDAAFPRGRGVTRAAAVVLSWPDLEPLEEAVAEVPLAFPYVPGLLSFRELPAVLAALGELRRAPDLIFCDGQGLAHPRRFGLACHLGVLAGLPAVGVGKSRLLGEHEEVPPERAAWRPLSDRGEVVGAVLRTRTGVKPLYVSVGHRVSLSTALDLVLAAAPRYRLPEPIRHADRLAAKTRQPK